MEPQARAGLRQPHHYYALSSGKHGDSLPLLPGSSRTAAVASQTGPDDLAAELNPHETELNRWFPRRSLGVARNVRAAG
jgi:hypothetical protein